MGRHRGAPPIATLLQPSRRITATPTMKAFRRIATVAAISAKNPTTRKATNSLGERIERIGVSIMEELQAASGARIALHRNNPPHCLYCRATPNTEEHVVPEAIGGRLWARILCAQHNSAIAVRADEPLSKAFAPYVTMLQVSRQRGGAGAEFTATGRDGKPVVILAEGFARELPLDVKRRDERGRIAHVEGDLAVLDGLPAEAFAEGVPRNIIAKITVPEARFTVASDDRIRPGVLKIALHFVAGFVTDVDLASAQSLWPFVLGEKNRQGIW